MYYRSDRLLDMFAPRSYESPFTERQYLTPPDNEAPEETGYNEDDFVEMDYQERRVTRIDL